MVTPAGCRQNRHVEKITLTGAQETMLATLYGRAVDSGRATSVLHDDEAQRAVDRIDYDFSKTGMNTTSAVMCQR